MLSGGARRGAFGLTECSRDETFAHDQKASDRIVNLRYGRKPLCISNPRQIPTEPTL
jgi:hypothetical protein